MVAGKEVNYIEDPAVEREQSRTKSKRVKSSQQSQIKLFDFARMVSDFVLNELENTFQ